MEPNIAFDVLSIVAVVVSLGAVASRWRTGARSRQESNLLKMSDQINQVYDLMDANLMEVVKTGNVRKLKRRMNWRNRVLMIQKLHVHLDALETMIKMEKRSFGSRLFGASNSAYYREVVRWYCSMCRLYNYLIKALNVGDTGFLHDGRIDPHRTDGGLPVFLKEDKYAKKAYEGRLKLKPVK